MGVSAQVLAARVLNSIPEGIAIAVFAWVLLKLVKQNSGTRFGVWLVSLVAIALAPFIPLMHGSVSRVAHAEITLPGEWAVQVLSAWGLVAFFGTARIFYGMVRLRAIRRESKSIDELPPEVSQVVQQSQMRSSVELRSSSQVRVPTAIGFFHPTILIPEWALRDLTPEELRAVVLHEFAHLYRRDDWTNLLQKFLRAIFFFHPAVLWVEKRLSLEREMACDDAVVEATKDAHGYARCLVSLAEKSLVRRGVALAQAAVGRARDTAIRLAQILALDRPKATRVFRPLIGAVAGVVVIAFAVMPSVPKLVSFENSPETASDMRPSIARSMVVPAAFRMQEPTAVLAEKTGTGKRSASTSFKVTSNKERRITNSSTESARVKKFGPHNPNAPLVVQAKLSQPPQQQMVVFTQTTDYYRQGAGVIGVTEWRLIVVNVPVTKTQQVRAPNRT